MKILLADDHGLFRDSMAVWLEQYSEPITITLASDWDSLTMHLDSSFNLIMVDLGMPGMSGVASICELVKQALGTPVLVVSANEEAQTIQACLECGASGYITKASDGKEILNAVTILLNGGMYQPPITHQSNLSLTEASFTKKQFELLAHLAEGSANKAIAQKMNLSEGTIKQYVSQLLTELNVDNRTQAGNKARKILGF